MGKAYGFFEIPSVTAAVVAVDIMCKTADVQFVTWEKKLGGRLVTIIIRGDVSAVAQAIEAAEQNGIKKPVSTVVIPSPHEEILRIINHKCKQGCIGGSYRWQTKKKRNNNSQSASQNCTQSKKDGAKGRNGSEETGSSEGGTQNVTGSIRNG